MICLDMIFWFGIFKFRVVFSFLLLYFLSHLFISFYFLSLRSDEPLYTHLFLLSCMIWKFLVTIQKHHGPPYLNTPIYPNFIYHVT